MAFDKIWDEIHENCDWGRYPAEYVIRFIARNYYSGNRGKTKILDFGCGQGANTWYLAREGFDTYAFDCSKAAIEKASNFLNQEKLSANFEVMDGTCLTYSDCFFDAVIDNVSIYANLYDDIIKMYKECYRTLKTGGRLLTSVFSDETLGYGIGVQLEPNTFKDITCGRLEGRGTTHFYSKNELEDLLLKLGFKNVTVDEMIYTDLGQKVGMFIVKGEK